MIAESKEWTLQGWGVQEWTWVEQQATGLTCAWADTTGFHVGECPSVAPPYTHLWAWNDEGTHLVRVRIDAGAAIVGVLTQGRSSAGADSAAVTEVVDVRIARALTFGPDDKRIGPQKNRATLPGHVSTYTVVGPMPITFVGPDSGGDDA